MRPTSRRPPPKLKEECSGKREMKTPGQRVKTTQRNKMVANHFRDSKNCRNENLEPFHNFIPYVFTYILKCSGRCPVRNAMKQNQRISNCRNATETQD